MNQNRNENQAKIYIEAANSALRRKEYATASRRFLDASERMHLAALECDDPNLASYYVDNAEVLKEKAFTYASFKQNRENDNLKLISSKNPIFSAKTGYSKRNSAAKSTSKEDEKEDDKSSSSSMKSNDRLTQWEPLKGLNVKLDDIAGLDEAKRILNEKAILPFKDMEKAKKFKRLSGGGILLYGLPGTGKTMFAKAVASELGAPFFYAKASSIKGSYVGETEKNIENLFTAARKYKLSVIFFDEFDDLALARGMVGSAYNGINTLLQCINGLDDDPSHRILLLAATNCPWNIDGAMLNRFSDRIEIGLPDAKAREFMLRHGFEGMPGANDLDYQKMVKMTEGFNGRDINAFIDKISAPAFSSKDPKAKISDNDVEEEGKKVRSSIRKEDIEKLRRYTSSNK